MAQALSATNRAGWPTRDDSVRDVVVIGAGPAGSVAACQLARQGFNTLLVDRQAFPRDKLCGGYVNGRALASLRAAEMSAAFDNADTAAANGFTLFAGGRSAQLPLHAGVVVERARFDAALAALAAASGAQFLPETTATVVAGEARAKFRVVHLRHHDGSARTIRARAVIAADGLTHPSVRELPQFASRQRAGSRVGIGMLLDDDSHNFPPGVICMAIARAGYVGIVRAASGRLNLAAAIDPLTLRAADSPATALREIMSRAGMPLPAQLPAQGWRGTSPLTCSVSRLAAERIFLLGDAAGYVEPFTGEGMAWAIESALSVVPCIAACLAQWDERLARSWESDRRRRMRRMQAGCRVLASLLRHPLAVDTTIRLLACLPGIARPFVRHLSAETLDVPTRTP